MKTFQFPKWEELPTIDLYMDQVITYLEQQLSSIYFYDEKFITKPMINNYVKTSIVDPPTKKHYSRKHIAYFLVVTILKRCYSMSQIAELIEIHTNMKDSTVEQAYNLFIQRFESILNNLFQNEEKSSFTTTIPQQILMDHVLQCICYKIHTEYILSKQ